MRSLGFCTAALLALTALPAAANDSTAELAAGGLKFLADPDIAMRSEDLSISPAAVHVSYTFFNASGADKTVLVAFPMPDITGSYDFTVSIPSDDVENPFKFSVKSDGVEQKLKLDARAFFNGVEQTALLQKLHVPLQLYGDAAIPALDRLSPAEKAQLEKLGIVGVDEYSTDAKGTMEKHMLPLWTYRAAFTWMQTFPAGKVVHLEQDYLPSVGGTAGTMVGEPGWRNEERYKSYASKYCINSSMESAAAAKWGKSNAPQLFEKRIDYILTTGANWAGPIGDFHLTVDKEQPNAIISFCADGVSKTGPTRFEVRRKNFTPTADLHILILEPYPAH